MAWLLSKRGVYYVAWRERGSHRIHYLHVGKQKRSALRAKTIIESKLLEGRVGGGVIPQQIAFGEYAEKWLAMRTVRPNTMMRDRKILKVHLLPTFSKKMLSTITAEHIADLAVRLTREVSPWTSRRALAVLSKMFNDAIRRDYLRENPVDKIDKPHLPPHEMRLLSVAEYRRVLGALPQRWQPLIFVSLLTGLRWGEVIGLEWSDVDLEAGKLFVRRAIPANIGRVSELKTIGSRRTVDLLPPVRQLFMDLPQRGALIFPAARGGYLNHRWFNQHVWRPTIKSLGLDCKFHDLRHGFGSLLLAWGEQILYVSGQLGHSSPSLTLNVYSHLMREGRRLDKEATLIELRDTLAYPVLTTRPSAASDESLKPSSDTGAGDRTRTDDLRITSALLYH